MVDQLIDLLVKVWNHKFIHSLVEDDDATIILSMSISCTSRFDLLGCHFT